MSQTQDPHFISYKRLHQIYKQIRNRLNNKIDARQYIRTLIQYLKRKIKEVDFNAYIYLLNKIYKLIHSTQIEKVDTIINHFENIIPSTIQNILDGHSPVSNCVGCSSFLIKNFPITSRQVMEYTLPYFIIDQANIYGGDDLIGMICALANVGGGHIIVVQRHIKNIIKEKLNNVNKIFLQRINILLQKALLGIVGKEHIFIYVDSVPLKSGYDQEDQEEGFVLRIRVNVSKNRQREGFYTQYRFKNFKPIYKIYDVSYKQTDSMMIQMEKKQIQFDYKKIHELGLRVDNQKIQCRCKRTVFPGIYFNINIQPETQNLKQQIKFASDPQGYTLDVFNQCIKMQKNKSYNFEQEEFPEVKQNQSIVIFSLQEKCNKEQLVRIVEGIFKETKTNFKRIFPMKEFQKSVLKYQKKNNIALYEIIYFIFEGKYELFRDKFLQVLNWSKIKKEQFAMEQLQTKIQLGASITQEQVNKFNELLFAVFTDLPLWTKAEYMAVQQKQKKTYKSPKLDLNGKNQGMFTYLVTHLAKLRPKFSTNCSKNNNNNHTEKNHTKYKQKNLPNLKGKY